MLGSTFNVQRMNLVHNHCVQLRTYFLKLLCEALLSLLGEREASVHGIRGALCDPLIQGGLEPLQLLRMARRCANRGLAGQ